MATSTNGPAYVAVHHITKQRAEEHHRGGGAPEGTRWGAIPWSHLRLVATGRAAVYEGARAMVRLLVKTLWLFPVLLVPKIVLWGLDVWYGDLITVAFVILVVVTFGALSVLSLLHLLAGSRSQRDAAAQLALALPNEPTLAASAETLRLPPADVALAPALEHLAQSGTAQGPLRVRGTIDAGLSPGMAVVSERWLELEDAVLRVVSGSSFALRVDGAPLVVVEMAGSPILLGPYREALEGLPAQGPASAARWLSGPTAMQLAAAPACVLRQGDVVEVCAPYLEIAPSAADLRLDGREPRFAAGDGGPYRGEHKRAIVLRCLPEAPVVIAPAHP